MDFKKSAIITIAILLMVIAFLLYIRGKEDAWVCVDNNWEKHGNPSTDMPTEGCGVVDAGPLITSFSECAAAGFAVMESFPRQCRDGKGILFIEEINKEASTTPNVATSTPDDDNDTASTSDDVVSSTTDDVILEYPLAEGTIKSPLEIRGKAKGTWFFEASFPVILTNWDGLIIAQGIATAQSDWMTEDYVPFTATLEFEADTTVSNRGALILQKDNPSGLPEHDDAFEITVFFE